MNIILYHHYVQFVTFDISMPQKFVAKILNPIFLNEKIHESQTKGT
jgi:hypothetical protein